MYLLCGPLEELIMISSLYKYVFSILACLFLLIIYRKSGKKIDLNPVDSVMAFLIITNIIVRMCYLPFESRSNYPGLSIYQVFFGVRYYALPYLMIFLVFFKEIDITFIKNLVNVQYFLLFFAIFFECYFIVFFLDSEYFTWYSQFQVVNCFEISFPLIFFISHLSEKKAINFLSFLFLVLFLFLAANYGRRGITIDHLLYIIGGIVIKISSSGYGKKVAPYIFFLLIVLFIIFPFISDFLNNLYIFERGLDQDALSESREKVFNDFFNDFNSKSGWWFGRGFDGSFERSDTVYDTGLADYVENGFLQVILKMGLIFLIPMVYFLIKGFFLSYYKSSNDLSKSIGLLLLIFLIGMFPFNVPDFSGKFLIIWVFISLAFSPKVRKFSNADIIQIINS
jgi:O-antigen ligase